MEASTANVAKPVSKAPVFPRLLPYLLILPALAVVIGLFFVPFYDGIKASFQLYRFGSPVENIGLDNYKNAFSDTIFTGSLFTTFKFVALTVTLETVAGVALAVFCYQQLRFLKFFRTVLIIPMVIMPIVVGITFRLFFASDVGFPTIVSGTTVQVLSKPTTAFLAVAAADMWEWTPLIFLIVLAGLQSLPTEPLEAARVDGAGGWRVFWDITFPMLRPVLAVAIVLRTVDVFGTFDQVFAMTGGGPGRATNLISVYGYDSMFKFQQFGYASAFLIMFAIIVLALIAVLYKVVRRGVRTS